MQFELLRVIMYICEIRTSTSCNVDWNNVFFLESEDENGRKSRGQKSDGVMIYVVGDGTRPKERTGLCLTLGH